MWWVCFFPLVDIKVLKEIVENMENKARRIIILICLSVSVHWVCVYKWQETLWKAWALTQYRTLYKDVFYIRVAVDPYIGTVNMQIID